MASETKEDALVDEHIAQVIAQVEAEDQQAPKETPKGKDSVFVWLIIGIALILGAIVFWSSFVKDEPPKTIDDLHNLNSEGKLPEEQGYLTNGFSFVKYNDFWYTQLAGKTSQFDIYMRYGPRDVKDIMIIGNLSPEFYKQNGTIYLTFDPYETNLQYHAVTVGDLSRALYGAFGIQPQAVCTKEHPDCEGRPLINCENATSPTLFLTNEEPTLIVLRNNCIQIQGKEFELVRAADRLLLSWYGII